MALSLDSGITTAEGSANQRASIRVTFSDETLRWSVFALESSLGTLDTDTPQTFINTTAPYAFGCSRRTDGKAYITKMSVQTAAHWALPLSTINSFAPYQLDGTGATVQYHTMRYGLRNESGNTYVYAALHNGSGVRIYRNTTGALAGSGLVACGSTFASAYTFTDTSDLVRRVEAVCPTSDGSIIVAVGTHDFENGFSVINFWWLEPSCGDAHQLDAAIHYAGFAETYSHWYDCARWASYICAEYDSDNSAIRVIANAHPNGQAVEFSVIRGASTPVRPILPIDPRYGDTTFRPASIRELNDLMLLTGRYTFTQADGTAVYFDCFLTSVDGLFWSFGERNFWIQSASSAGTILPDTSVDPDVLYYGGNGRASLCLGTPQIGFNTSTKQLAAVPLPGWSLTQGVNAPNSFTFSVIDDDGTLLESPLLTRGTVVYLTAGQWSTFDDIAAFTIDAPAERVSVEQGREAVRITARDLGNKFLARHNLSVALDYRGLDTLDTELNDLTGLVMQTRKGDVHEVKETDTSQPDLSQFDHVFNENGLEDKALNNPIVAFADLAEEPAWFQGFTVETPDTGDTASLPTFALLWGGTDSGFLGYIIPRASDWASTKTKPRVVLSNLRPFDGTTGEGPYQFPDGAQGLWQANNYDSTDDDAKYLQATIEEPDNYGSEGTFSQAAGATRDYRLRRNNRRLQLYSRLHDYAPATVASRTWTPVSSYAFSDDACMEPAERSRLGLAVDTDTFALLGRGLPPKRESQLSNAAEREATYGFFVITGQVSNSASTTHMVNADYAGAGLTVGMRILIDPTWGSNFFTYITGLGTNTMDISTTINSEANQFFDVYVHGTASESWGWADSGYRTIGSPSSTPVQVNPHADKQPVLVEGRGTFISDDATLLSSRIVNSTGDHAELLSGNTERQTAWDEESPLTTNMSSWRLVLPPNTLLSPDDSDDLQTFTGWLSDMGFPDAGFMKTTKKEIVRYAESEFTSPGGVPGDNPVVKHTFVPTYFAALEGQSAGLALLTQLDHDGHVIGDNWMFIGSGTITDGGVNTDPAGLRAEITSKTGGKPQEQRYVTGVDWKDSGDHALGGYVSLDKPIQGEVRQSGSATYGYDSDSGDLAIFDGRAQLGTQFADDPGGTLMYYPAAEGTDEAVDAFVRISHYTAQSGRYRSVEDAIYALCSYAGVRIPIFRTLMNDPYIHNGVTWEITTTPQALPLITDLQDFDLRMNAHITDDARLYIDFRGLYRLSIREDGTTPGLVNIGIIDFTDTFGITASGGDKWIQKVDGIYISSVALCPSAADTVPLRVTAVDNRLIIEICGVHAWTFDFSELNDGGSNDYYTLQPGYIALSYSTSVADNSNTAKVSELWMPIRPIVQAAGTNTASALRTICDRYHVRSRMQPDGRLEFAQFITRDDIGTTTQGLPIAYESTSDDSQPAAHVAVIGEQSGGYLNSDLLTTEGYSYKSVSVEGVTTVAQAQFEAQIISRESAEFSRQATLEGLAKLEHQPEDGITVAYGTPPTPPAEIDWFKAGGIDDECVLGAWQAANRDSYLDSVQDLSGNGHTLSIGSGSYNWDTDEGWIFDESWYLRTGVNVGSTWPSPTQSILVCFGSLQGYSSGVHEGVLAGAIENWGVLFVGNTTSTASLQFGNMFTFQSDPSITFEGAGGTAIVAGDTLYWNGTANKTETFGTTSFNGPAECFIGCGNRHGAPFMPVNAKVRAVVIYDCVLTADQITAIMNALTSALTPVDSGTDWWVAGGIDTADVQFAYQPLCAEDFNASLVNLNDPGTADATLEGSGAGVDFDPSYGWNFNDALSWLSTHTPQDDDFTDNTILVRVSANLDWGQYAAGMDVAGGGALNLFIDLVRVGSGPYTIGVWCKAGAKALSASSASPYNTGIATDWDSGGGVPDPFPPTNDFVIGIANDKLYINGANVATLGTANTTGSTADILLGAADQDGGNVGPLMQAAVSYSRVLNDTEMADVSAAMLALTYPCSTSEDTSDVSRGPTLPPTGYVITQLTWSGQADSIRATYRLRQPWPFTGPVTGPS